MTPTMSTMKPINQNNKNSRKAAQRIVLAFLSCTNASLQALNPQKLHRLLLFFYLHFCLCPSTNVIKCITFLLSTPQILTSPRAAFPLIKILILNHILPPYLPTKDKSPTTHRRHMLSFLKVVSKILRNLRILHPPQLYDFLLYLSLQIRSSNFLLAPSGHMRKNLTIKQLSSLRLPPSLSNISLSHSFPSPSHSFYLSLVHAYEIFVHLTNQLALQPHTSDLTITDDPETPDLPQQLGEHPLTTTTPAHITQHLLVTPLPYPQNDNCKPLQSSISSQPKAINYTPSPFITNKNSNI